MHIQPNPGTMHLASQALLIALSVAHAQFNASCELDEIGLLQIETLDVDPCACMEFKQVYKDGAVQCGATNELTNAPEQGLPGPGEISFMRALYGAEFCNRFYQKLPYAMCSNVMVGFAEDWTGGQWCYVSSTCSNLRSGAVVPGSNVAWKTCDAQDPRLRNVSVAQLIQMAKDADLDFGLLAKLAYPNIPASMHLSNAEQIAQQKQADSPLVFDSDIGQPPFQVVSDGQIYLVELSDATMWDESIGSSYRNVSCVQGC